MDFSHHPLNNSNSNRVNKVNTIAIAIDDNKIDALLDQFSELYPISYRAWHAKWIKQHGLEPWIQAAKTAQQEGRIPQRHFAWLLNRYR